MADQKYAWVNRWALTNALLERPVKAVWHASHKHADAAGVEMRIMTPATASRLGFRSCKVCAATTEGGKDG